MLAKPVFHHLVRDNELPNSSTPTALTQDATGLARDDRDHDRFVRYPTGPAGHSDVRMGDIDLCPRGSSRDGLGNTTLLTVPVRVLPAWFQTLAFGLLTGVASLCLLWVAYRLRISCTAERLRERHRARIAERDRIARELHDTLLQSTEGLILKLHSVVNQLDADDPRRELLAASLDRASALAYEGRERIQGLRDAARSRPEIGQALEKVARDMAQGTTMQIKLDIKGRVRELRADIWEELYPIGYEAIWNVCRHARAQRVDLVASYSERELLIAIGDDGRGITPALLQSANASGHFGLAGMRERARGMNARFDIQSNEGFGTRVEVRIDCRFAYLA